MTTGDDAEGKTLVGERGVAHLAAVGHAAGFVEG